MIMDNMNDLHIENGELSHFVFELRPPCRSIGPRTGLTVQRCKYGYPAPSLRAVLKYLGAQDGEVLVVKREDISVWY